MEKAEIESTVWDRIKERLKAELGTDVYNSWFARVACVARSSKQIDLTVPTQFLRTWIRSNYYDRLVSLWEAELGEHISVEILYRRNGQPLQTAQEQTTVTPQMAVEGGEQIMPTPNLSLKAGNRFTGSPLDQRFNLQTFVVGNNNELAYNAALRIARATRQDPIVFNPFHVYSNVGLGKTHLLQAIAWEARRLDRTKHILYITAERFMYGFVSSLKQQSTLHFKDEMRDCDLLLIDDLQFLQGKTVQQEFCHTVNTLIDGGKQVVVASDRPAHQLENLEERVRSRIAGGFAAEMGILDFEQRQRILQQRIQHASNNYPNFEMPEDVVTYVAQQVSSNGRDLEGAFNRLLAHNQLTHRPITMEVAERAIKDLVSTCEPRRVLIEDIQRVVSRHYNVTRADMVSARRTRSVVRPRQVAMYLAKVLTPRSLPEIGRRFGGRDHTTVLHAVRKVEKYLEDDKNLVQELDLLRRMIED